MNNLVIDIGNNFVKLAVFENTKLLRVQKQKIKDEIILEQEYDNVIVSSVSLGAEYFINKVNARNRKVIFDTKTLNPIKNKYKTPKTLGLDRLAGVIGASQMYPNKDVLVVDAGTAITFDFISKDKEYLGGTISPGLQMRFKALNILTSKLPIVDKKKYSNSLQGTTTEESIANGVVSGMIFEIEGYINEYKDKYPGLKTILTGGDAFFFDKKLKSTIFADCDLVLKGLNEILMFNE